MGLVLFIIVLAFLWYGIGKPIITGGWEIGKAAAQDAGIRAIILAVVGGLAVLFGFAFLIQFLMDTEYYAEFIWYSLVSLIGGGVMLYYGLKYIKHKYFDQ